MERLYAAISRTNGIRQIACAGRAECTLEFVVRKREGVKRMGITQVTSTVPAVSISKAS